MKGMGNMGEMLKKAQQLQKQMAKIQDELKGKRVQASSGGGVVSVEANGAGEIMEIKIDKEIFEAKDIDMMQDLVMAAVNEALARAKEEADAETKKLTGGLGLDIPGMF